MGRLERLLNKAINFTENGKCEEALNLIYKAQLLAPEDPEVYNSFALTYDAMNNFELSVENFQKALDLDSSDPHIFTQFGITLCRMGRLSDAVDKFNKALSISPDFIMAKWHLGIAFKMMGFYDESVKIFNDCIQPESSEFDYVKEEVYYQLGICYFDMGWTLEALKNFRQQLDINPQDDWTLLSIGNCYFDLGWVDESIETFKNVIKISPELISAYNSLATSYAEKGWYDEAIEVLRQAQNIAPEDESIRENIEYIESLKDNDGKNSTALLSIILEIIKKRNAKSSGKTD